MGNRILTEDGQFVNLSALEKHESPTKRLELKIVRLRSEMADNKRKAKMFDKLNEEHMQLGETYNSLLSKYNEILKGKTPKTKDEAILADDE